MTKNVSAFLNFADKLNYQSRLPPSRLAAAEQTPNGMRVELYDLERDPLLEPASRDRRSLSQSYIER